MNDQHTKVLNTDSSGKNRLRYASSRKRARTATSDVYRSYKRRINVTSAASREERVHHADVVKKKKKRALDNGEDLNEDDAPRDDDDIISASTFSSELDIALDRNASEIFAKFHREIWSLVRSLPEVLHHSTKIVDLLLAYLLSPASSPGEKSTPNQSTSTPSTPSSTVVVANQAKTVKKKLEYVVNQATTDILHLLAVLARDLRHEIHPHLHTKIMPRLLSDLLNPPTTTEQQSTMLDVTLVEATFRTLSYIFRYNSQALLSETVANKKETQTPCLEPMRQYYGATLAHRRDLIRRLAAESYAPLIRKLSQSAMKKHLKRILKAVAAAAASPSSGSGDGSKQRRLQSDAVDGISLLFFEVARGAAGRMHSKAGHVAIACLLDSVVSENTNGKKKDPHLVTVVSLAVAKSFFDRMCNHLKWPNVVPVLSSVILACTKPFIGEEASGSIRSNGQNTHNGVAAVGSSSLEHLLKLVQQVGAHKDGALLSHNVKVLDEIEGLLAFLLHQSRFVGLTGPCQEAVVDLVVSTWKFMARDADFALRMTQSVRDVLDVQVLQPQPEQQQDGDDDSTSSSSRRRRRTVAGLLVQDLMPHLILETCMNTIGTAVLVSAAGISREEPSMALTLVHAMASLRSKSRSTLQEGDNNVIDHDNGDDFFFIDHAAGCSLSDGETDRLLIACLGVASDLTTKQGCATLAAAGKAASFLAAVGGDVEGGKRLAVNYKKVSKWLLELLQKIDKRTAIQNVVEADVALVLSVAIESLARLSSLAVGYLHDNAAILSTLEKARPIVLKHLMARTDSLLTVKSVASFVVATQSVELLFSNDPDKMFEALLPNLRDKNHFRRLHSLQILASYPKRPFVVDHADLDLADDLDEEASPRTLGSAEHPTSIGLAGPCTMVDSLLAIEATPAGMDKERFLVSTISRVGVLGRTGKLPVLYAETAAAHMIGVLHIKFAPVWPAAVKALVGLTKRHEECVWPALHKQITAMMQNLPYQKPSEGNAVKSGPVDTLDPISFYSALAAWDSSRGCDTLLFDGDIMDAEEHGKVSRHHCTDEASLFESLWGVAEGAPQLITAHSRSTVPIFLGFMHHQFYRVHSQDPDARELLLGNHVAAKDNDSRAEPNLSLDGRVVQRRLQCMLKAFSSVKGPHQLFKHSTLLSIFLALLDNQDTRTAEIALSCVLKFKLPYLAPYADSLTGLYEKGKLRDAMMNLTATAESGKLMQDHRKGLVPVLSRILFGRLSARAGAKSSKDAPAARRSAVLSFLSGFCVNDDEVYPFVYLMLRVYVPASLPVKALELQDEADKTLTLEHVASLSPEDCLALPPQVHQGFLNALEAVLAQLGRKVTPLVPTFLSIVMALCRAYEVKAVVVSDGLDEEALDDEEGVTSGQNDRGGSIRSLCYRRLSEIFSKFSDEHDFTRNSGLLWGSLQQSLLLLPVMIVNSDKVPALLLLLRTLSGEQRLIKMLKDDPNVVPCVLKCLSERSKPAVIDACLTFIDNLLTDESGCGRELLQDHVVLMLGQFRLRLGCVVTAAARGPKPAHKNATGGSVTWRRELTILCQVSELIDAQQLTSSEFDAEAIESLFSLLIPFLNLQRGIPDSDKLNVLAILDKIVAKIPAESSAKHYITLSALLGPIKAKAGNTSRDLRKSLASVLNRMAIASYSIAAPATAILVRLATTSTKRVDEMEYDVVIPVLSDLGSASEISLWTSLCSSSGEPSILLPVVHTCFHLLFDEDGVVSRGAFKAIKTLIAVASKENVKGRMDDDTSRKWNKLLEGCIVHLTRSGLASRNLSARRFCILLIGEVARCNKDSSSPNLYGDLTCLIRDDEPDLDFFLNITHVQIHRRGRALQRLRKVLAADVAHSKPIPLSMQSLSNVLLPLATHPVYEVKTNIEESFALEGIATVGAIARHLSWSKYNSTLWTHLSQFERHPEQEKYLIGLICAIIDGFHFEIIMHETVDGIEQESLSNSAVWRALENRIIPKTESLLLREKEKGSNKSGRMLRPSVVLALLKLFNKLPSKLFEAKLPRLLTVLCDALRNRESNSRDVARTSLAKMVVEMDMKYLADVVRELTTTLTEGYKLHVRTATIHTILTELSHVYKPPTLEESPLQPAFDKTVPALMDLLQQDLFGVAQERRDAQGVQLRYVKEAGGSKSAHSLELISSLIQFRPLEPSEKLTQLPSSSIHVIVSPLLERLRAPGVSTSVARRVKDGLSRIVTGLLRNPSLQANDVLMFVRTCLKPYVGRHEIESVMASMDDDLSGDDEEPLQRIIVSGKRRAITDEASSVVRGQVVVWGPSTLKTSASAKAAQDAKKKEEAEICRVIDGASAPRMTGSRRSKVAVRQGKPSVNDPGTISAAVFCLQLLSPTLKNSTTQAAAAESTLDQFVPLLTTCICRCRDTEVVLLSLRCLGWLLKTNLPSLARCSKSLATKTLDLLTSAGANQELMQAAFKMLTLLMTFDRKGRASDAATSPPVTVENTMANSTAIPLDDEQMQVLISFLRESIVTSDQHNPAIALVKAIMSRRYISSDFYDLMETMLEQSVRSPKASLRDQSGGAFVNYLINYPLSTDRIEQHLKQIVLNVSYEYTEGRLSAIRLASSILDKIPVPLIEQHCQLFYLPLTLQLANDEAKECREAVSKCLGKLTKRLSTEVLQSLYGYTVRWSYGDVVLRRMSLQLFGIFVETRTDFIKRGDATKKLLATVERLLKENADEWEIVYFALILLEKIAKSFRTRIEMPVSLWNTVIKSMANSHAWVKLASCRLLSDHLNGLDPVSFKAEETFLVETPGAIYQIARNLCFQLGSNEEEQMEDLSALVIKALTWLLQAMKNYPDLCFEEGEAKDRDPVQWVMTRLSNVAKDKGTKRRSAVYKCFAAFATLCGDIAFDYLELMLEPLYRTETETRNELELPSLMAKARPENDVVSEEAQLAKDVLHLIEENCESQDAFLKAYAAVKTKSRDRKDQRKLEEKTEVVTDPQNAAKRRIDKQDREKKRRKRRVDDRRLGRGGTQKRKYL